MSRALGRRIALPLGQGGSHVLGRRARPGDRRDRLTRNEEQVARYCQLLEEHPELRVDRVSWQWVRAAADSIRTLSSWSPADGPASTTRTLVAFTPDDQIVNGKACHSIVGFQPDALHRIEFPGAQHELLMELPQTVTALWHQIDTRLT